MTVKKFRLKANEIKDLKISLGACFATDKITVEGKKVNFMYRQKSDNAQDSGWRFFSGEESEEYTNDPNNTSIFDVNTIANYDSSIIPFLDSSSGSVFERNQKTGQLSQIFDFKFPE